MCRLNADGKLNSNLQDIADTFNKQFLLVAENLNTKNNHSDSSINNLDNTMPIHYFYNLLRVHFMH